ncbi:MAG: peptidylprolyl isomerase [Bacteroidales bacterium]|nr:peptidylprolyl isomerase [Bacteroidales bacterium]
MKLKRFFALITFVTICSSAIYAQQSQVVDKVVAVVGSNIIMQSDIEEQYMQYRLQGGIKGSASSIRCEILEDQLFRKLMLNQAELDSIEITDDQIEQEMEYRIRYFVNQLGSQEKLEKYYNKSMKEIKNELRTIIKDQKLIDEVQRKIVDGVSATPSDVRQFFENIPSDSIPLVSAQYEIAELVKKPPITFDEKLAVKDRLYGLRSRILKGERFSTLALLYSEDPGSAKKGGELGFKGRGELVPEFEAAAFALKDGEISEVVETEYGFHIIQLIERRGDYVNVRHILLQVKVSTDALEKAYYQLDSIAKLIRNDSITFDEAVVKFSDEDDKVNGGYLVNPNTGSTLFSAEDLDQQISVVVNRLQVGEVSNPVPMKTKNDKDAYRLLIIKRKTTPHKANLKDDYALIQQWTMQKLRQEAINKWIETKSKKAYVKISDDYCDCDFQFDWKTNK